MVAMFQAGGSRRRTWLPVRLAARLLIRSTACACAAETIVKVYINSRRRTWLPVRLAARLLIRSTAYAHAQRQEL